jgi:hypothetical protein
MPRGIRNSSPTEGVEPDQTPALSQPSQRAQEARRERRRRDDGDLDGMSRLKLAIPPSVKTRLDAEGKVARWILDDKNRLADTHENDWDVTPGVEAVPAGEGDLKLVLHEKFRDWWDEDQRKKAVKLDKMDRAIERGEASGGGSNAGKQLIATSSINQISRG